MTDVEIIKALEICDGVRAGNCRDCPMYDVHNCYDQLDEEIHGLIYRQQEQINALIAGQETLQKHFTEKMARIVEQLERISPVPDTKRYALEDEYTAAFEMHEKCMEIVKGVQNE